MKTEKYSMSFTAGSLLQKESVIILEQYHEIKDWKLVRDKTLTENLLQSRTINTLKRHTREIISRLKTLSPIELQWLHDNSTDKQVYMLWVAFCRRYPFIGEFATEVIRERYLSLQTDVSEEDYHAFFNQKAQWHEELDNITDSTRQKQRQIVFQTLKQVGLLDKRCSISPAQLPSDFTSCLLRHSGSSDIHFFPIFDSDIPTQ